MARTYDPKSVEDKWYAFWQENGFFRADEDQSKEPFCIVIPPPNITGELHMGHALDNTYQDILIRWKRMQGYNALWVPGTDHAGIATQARVEEHLRATENKTRHDLGREEFLKRTWAWREKYGDQILNQLKKLGASPDWERERFTLDEGCSKAVRQVFVSLFEKGLIYQGNYNVNWCPNCATTLSDIEVEHEEEAGKLYHIKYPFSGEAGFIEIATTRPETMLGDTAIAVNPDDKRYSNLVGKKVTVPLIEREIPIIADNYVDLDFGTGMVKVTPAHDPNDFEIGLRHNLAQVQVIGLDAKMTEEAGDYAGLDRYDCRRQVVADLADLGLLVKVEEHEHAVGHCYRCSTVVEPQVSKQWFVKMADLAKPAIAAVENGEIKFVPNRFSKHYLHWMGNLKDWCISRQLWWGHRIPVWYCAECGEVFAALEDPSKCPKCNSSQIEQDPDVLDTWFSSALWPFSVLGWPDRTPELEYFYPTSVLVTGFDIIFFWVARMIVMGYEFMNEKPFGDVLIHGLVRDHLGRKMSKSLGNGVDPLEAIEEYGADALRFNLVVGVAPGNDMRFIPEKIEAYRNFANKIWNASRFALMHLEDFQTEGVDLEDLELNTVDRWILSRYEFAAGEVTRFLTRYDIGESARVLYDFIWTELCDWYIELIKPRLYGRRGKKTRRAAQYVLWYVLKHTMELLHPFMPFITEEIWQSLPNEGPSIMVAKWPEPKGLSAPDQERIMDTVMAVITAIRTMRSEKNVAPGRKITAVCQGSEADLKILAANRDDIMTMAGLETMITEGFGKKPRRAVSAVVAGINIFLPLADMVDLEAEKKRIEKELEVARKEQQRAESMLKNEGFIKNAPRQVVEKEREKAESYASTVRRLQILLQEMQD
ncbi:MAG TPA: valine--tRNA ligase [Firmicutes bacterium]|nr:valine--tRNA ligase [Bacillota bacterium]